VILTLTAKGQKIWNRLMAVVEQRNAEIVSCLTPQEVQQFSKLLDRLLEQARLHHQTEEEDKKTAAG
jgi:DNA-binding MarR family transcriptional regulator